MAAKEVATATLRLDPELKEEATRIFSRLGFSFNTGVEVCLRGVVRTNGIPFDLTLGDDGNETGGKPAK